MLSPMPGWFEVSAVLCVEKIRGHDGFGLFGLFGLIVSHGLLLSKKSCLLLLASSLQIYISVAYRQVVVL